MAQEGKIDMEKAAEAYRRAGTPGEPHRQLARLAGSWTTRTRGWTDPDKPPMEGTGTCEQTMLFDGRYLEQRYVGEMMGNPFAGTNLIGYDNHTGKYVSTWIDSMSTGIYYFVGTGSADGRTIVQECDYDDPVRGPMIWRSVTKIVDDDTLECEMYLVPKDGKEEKAMEITVSRKI